MSWKNAALFSLGETRFYNVVFKIPLGGRHGRKVVFQIHLGLQLRHNVRGRFPFMNLRFYLVTEPMKEGTFSVSHVTGRFPLVKSVRPQGDFLDDTAQQQNPLPKYQLHTPT